MKNIARSTIAFLTLTCGTAFAAPFTLGNLPASAPSMSASSDRSFTASYSFQPAAAARLKDGYIGTIHVDENVVLNITTNNGPTSVPVPEPASLVLLGSGMLLAAWRRRQTA